MTKKQAVILTALTLIVFALGFLVTRAFWFRLDLTKNKAYTISKVSRNLHTEIPNQVRITYYLSDKLKSMHPLPAEIEDLLREYAAYSRGKIQVTVRDPVKAQLVDAVEQLGIQAQQIQTMAQDETGLITVYSGVTIEYLDQIEVLPLVFSLSTLEYDLTSRIRALARGVSRQAGIIAADNPGAWQTDYGYLNNAFAQAGYQIRLIAPEAEIPETLPLLIVLGGVETLNDAALYQIDRYVQQGGKVLFTVKGVAIDTENTLEARLLNDRGLLQMLASYGVTVLPEIAMDRSALTMQYQTRTAGGSVMMRIIQNAQWIMVMPENGNPEHPASAGFNGLDMYWPSPLELNAPENVEAVPLFTTSGEAWSMKEAFSTNPEISYLFEKDAASTRGMKILGASLSGTFPSWFKNKPKPETAGGELPDMPAEAQTARIIVAGDTEFASNFLGVTGGQRNLDFLIQAAGWLGNDDDIIGIRARESQTGRLDLIIDPEKRAAAMWFAQAVNIFVMPFLAVLAGIFIALRRRAKSRAVKTAADDGKSSEGAFK